MRLPRRASGMKAFQPLQRRGRRAIGAILLTFALCATVTVALSIRASSKSRNRTEVFQVAARQQTLAGRYVSDILLARSGARADPTRTGEILAASARVLLNGGIAPEILGDDDAARLSRTDNPGARRILARERLLVGDLTATGRAILAGRSVAHLPMRGGESIVTLNPIQRLRVLAALTASVSLNAERAIIEASDRNVSSLITLQILLGLVGLIISLLLGLALIQTTRRQTAHFRSLVTASTDLVFVLGARGCVYAGNAVLDALGCTEGDVLGDGLKQFVHPDDWATVAAAQARGAPAEIVIRMRDHRGDWRRLETHVTDLRANRQVRGVVLNARDITERLRLEEELTRLAFHDDLTGLPNRLLFRDRVEQALTRASRANDRVAVLLIDLDGFKEVNDSLGHDAGDELLRQMASRLGELAGPRDTLARLGGDEFVLLLERAAETQAIAVAESMLAVIRRPLHIEGRDFALSASVGIAMQAPRTGNTATLIRHADLAMYAAKAAGRGRFEVFEPAMDRVAIEQLGLEHDLKLALKRGELTLLYQPEINLRSTMLTGVEALSRWTSPSRGVVAPSEFIPVAETSGMILEIGELVLVEACEQTVRWRDAGLLPDGFVTWVNVSVAQLAAGGFATFVERLLRRTGLDAHSLGLEITESAFVEEGPTALRTRNELDRLHSRGVRLAIDDFGTGFSSLSQLRHFPIDMLKIDRAFVSGVEHNATDAAITANLVSLAHSLDSVAIAEGIETVGQLAHVRELGCELGQGVLFSPPLPADAMSALLADGQTPAAQAA